MITRTMRIQLLGLALVAAIGVSFVAVRYANIASLFGLHSFPVTMQMAQSGGIFTGADVTYRGVSVGRVGPMTLTQYGIDVQLDVNRSAEIPSDVTAEVRNLSAIGEQYVDLLPRSDAAPPLKAGDVIPQNHIVVPTPVQDLVSSVDDLVTSVPLNALRTTVDELGLAFNDTAQPLQRLLDTTGEFTAAAIDALPQTTALIDDGQTVLKTQNDVSGQFKDFSANLAQVAEQLKESNPDLRRVIQYAPPAAEEISGLLQESGSGIGDLLANLLTTSRILEPRQANLRQVLVTYPGLVNGVFTVVPGDGTAHLGLVLNVFDPPPCTNGYQGTHKRPGSDVTDVPVNANAHCAEPPGSPIDVRGAQNVPRVGTPDRATPKHGSSDSEARKASTSTSGPSGLGVPSLPSVPLVDSGLLAPLTGPAQILG